MVKFVAVVGAAALLLVGCSGGSDSASTSAGPTASSSASAPAPTASAADPLASSSAAADGFTMVSGDLARSGGQLVMDAAVADQTVVASVMSQAHREDFDAGIVYSNDNGTTWAWGGVIEDEGRTIPEGIALTPNGALIVGTTTSTSGQKVIARAFMAAAQTPEFVPKVVELPEQFAGDNVHLQDVVVTQGLWVVAGYTQEPSTATTIGAQHSVLWISLDEGLRWTKQEVNVPGSTDNSIRNLVVAPDGAWNAVGTMVTGDGANQHDAMWIRSEDAGSTWQVIGAKEFAAPFDQGLTSIVFAADSSAGLLGWDEAVEGNTAPLSALWEQKAGAAITRIGQVAVPVDPSTPPGEFIDGLLWDASTLIAWGSTTGTFPMENVQFWSVAPVGLSPLTQLLGNGTPIAVRRILSNKGVVLMIGIAGATTETTDVAVWRRELAAP